MKIPLITEIQRFCLQDGPGIRSTIFIKGCPLHCPWCHNPETQHTEKEFYYHSDKCVHCGKCVEVCPSGASTMETSADGKPVLNINRSKCAGCVNMSCIEACPTGAREAVGQQLEFDAIIKEVISDRPFYKNSGGGVTISGGDPLLFPKFTLEIAKKLKEEQIHVGIETSCFAKWEKIQPLLPYVGMFLVDIKSLDPIKHKETVGWPLEPILSNIQKLLESGANVRIHLPIIPGFNDTNKDFEAYVEFLRQFVEYNIHGVDALPYHVYGESKYRFLGRHDEYQFKNVKNMPAGNLKPLVQALKAAGIKKITIGGMVGMGGDKQKK
ncbi:glycyl-radical enzyme activating protein [Desulfosarcina ovata]|nr:glycyl-radical enzyme activating protein [Desulfosarcina ovata]